MTELTPEDIFRHLTERGRLEWELATRAALIEAQRLEIDALSNGHAPVKVEAVDDRGGG